MTWEATRASRILGALGAGLLLIVATAVPAQAHVAIRLDVRTPRPGAIVPRTAHAVVFAQPTLGGVDRVAIT